MQAEVLAIIFDEVEYMAVEACYDVKKIGAAARLVEQYVVRLDEAIRGREEHHQMFFAESTCVRISRCISLVDLMIACDRRSWPSCLREQAEREEGERYGVSEQARCEDGAAGGSDVRRTRHSGL